MKTIGSLSNNYAKTSQISSKSISLTWRTKLRGGSVRLPTSYCKWPAHDDLDAEQKQPIGAMLSEILAGAFG